MNAKKIDGFKNTDLQPGPDEIMTVLAASFGFEKDSEMFTPETEIQPAADATAPVHHNRKTAAACCKECGNGFQALADTGKRKAKFCSRDCIRVWNNRRAKNGAQVYDLLMALRYEREDATRLQLWGTLTRLTQSFREDDMRERGGRKSWQDIGTALENKVHLAATVIVGPRRKGKRQKVSI